MQSKGSRDGEAIRRDEARMARVAAGDQAAFASLVADYAPRLLRFATSMLGSGPAEAEEVVQEAMIRLWRHAGSWQPDGRISTWLHRVTYHLAIDGLRRRRPSVGIETVEDTIEDGGPEPDARLIRVEDVQACAPRSRACRSASARRSRSAISRG